MHHLVVCIPTYKRPELLVRTLQSILDNDLTGEGNWRVDIVVVDNDTNRTAESTTKSFNVSEDSFFKIHYHNFGQKGLSKVRNALIEKALALQPNFVAFIDDDEYASMNWMKSLVNTANQENADMVLGPVSSVFEKPLPEFLTVWFKQPKQDNSEQVRHIASNNLLIRTDFLIKTGIRFDPRFNTTGAEDTYFGIEAKKRGAKIAWSPNALVYETVLENRATLSWLFRRRYRGAVTYSYILMLEQQYFQALKKGIVSIVYLIAGLPGLLLLPFNVKNKYWGILKLAEGLGGISGLLSIKYHEYK